MSDYEKTQQSNPNQITVNQHIHMAATISRFCGQNGKVQVRYRDSGKVQTRGPRERIFFTKRVWDQRSEGGYAKSIEDKFLEETSNWTDFKL